ALDLREPRLHLLHLGARVCEAALQLVGLGANALVAFVHLGLAPLERLALGCDAGALLREALLRVGQAAFASAEVLLAALELVLAGLPLAIAGGELVLGLRQLLLAGGERGRALGHLGRAPACEALRFG